MEQNLKQYAPATQRNRLAILDVLKRVLPKDGGILEIASGTGEHCIFFAPHFHPRQWIPSDIHPESLNSIQAWIQGCKTNNIQEPLFIDVTEKKWFNDSQLSLLIKDKITSIININMIHIAPWEACAGLFHGARKILPSGGILYLYGPFKIQGKHTAPSNEQFDHSLRMRNPQWGVRNLDDVMALAKDNGFTFKETVAMPANNFSVIFERNDHR